jgi:flagellar protein FliS
MYAANTLSRRYTEAQVASVDRHRLLLLVFEGGLTFLGRARSALDAGDMVRFGEAISKSQAVIAELLGTLDHQQGGDIAKELARLYEFMQHHLTEANVRKSVQHVDEVERVLGIIAGAYREILERPPVAAGSTAA